MIGLGILLVLGGNYVLGYLGASLWIVMGIVIWLYRDPNRRIPPSPLGVVSPVDGRVDSVQEIYDTYLDRESIRVKIKISQSGVFSVRSVTEGKIMSRPRNNNANTKSTNGTVTIWVQTDEADDLVVILQPGSLQKHLYCNLVPGERIGQGQRYGFLLFGYSADVLLPVNSQVKVKKGDKVLAGTDIIAELVHG